MIDTGTPKLQLSENTTNMAGMLVGFVGENKTLSVITRDGDGVVYEPASVSLTVYNGATGVPVSDPWEASGSSGTWRSNYAPANTGSFLIRWRSVDDDDSLNYGTQFLVVIDARVQSLIYMIRSMIDKSIKDITQTYGYTDADVFMYLLNAIGHFNALLPMSSFSVGTWPAYLDNILIELASLYAIRAQMLYSVDTDVSYSDQGISLNIDHFTKLGSYYEKMYTEIDKRAKMVKWAMGSRASLLVSYNPERYRSALIAGMANVGFPYFYLGTGTDILLR
jgi:hypothetical protein